MGLGLVALLAFLATLEVVFIHERRDGAAQLSRTRGALEQYAAASTQHRATQALSLADARLAALEADPLGDESGLFLRRDGVTLFPRTAADESRDVEALVAALEDGRGPKLDSTTPWGERVALLEQLRLALLRRSDADIERTARAFLLHRTRYLLPPEEDLPATLAMVELLSARSTPSGQLLRQALRDGFGGERHLEGLQPAALRAWSRLGDDDIRFLCARITALSHDAGVSSEDFEAACGRHPDTAPLALPETDGVWLEWGDASRVMRVEAGTTVGVALSRPLLAELMDEWRGRGLLEAADTLDAMTDGARWRRLETVHPRLRSPRLDATEASLSLRFALKTTLVAVALLLGVGLVLAAATVQARRARYLALQADFVATVSHELRTPLASLRAMAETLERRLEGHAPARDYPARMVRAVDGLSLLVENILSFNRLGQRGLRLHLEEVPLSSLEAALREEAALAQGVEVEQRFSGFSGAAVRADGPLLHILLANLLRNAWKHGSRRPVMVRWEAEVRDDGVVLRITDNGPGLTDSVRTHLFEAFFTGGRGGTGLGLAVCQRIVRAHGGTLHVAASSSEGTTFEVTLPAVR